ncbi:proline racemase family protein [Microbulbifer taiwanensis]
MHTGGEPLRVILDGFPEISGKDVLDCRSRVRAQFDHLRTALMWEPRGHADMYGCLLVPPNSAEADFGVIFLHNEGYSTMCGHAVIALATLAVEMGWVDTRGAGEETAVTIDAPCGRIHAFARQGENERVESARFLCVPSFVLARNQRVSVPGLGQLNYDIAYGGAFYAYVDAAQLPFSLSAENATRIIDAGRAVKKAVAEQGPAIEHPYETDLSFLYGTIFLDSCATESADSRNACVFADGELDRSPTGSGVAGRMALHHAQGLLPAGKPLRIESILGSVFTGKVADTTHYGGHPAVIPEIQGSASITGEHRFHIDPADPFKHGFFLR